MRTRTRQQEKELKIKKKVHSIQPEEDFIQADFEKIQRILGINYFPGTFRSGDETIGKHTPQSGKAASSESEDFGKNSSPRYKDQRSLSSTSNFEDLS